MAEHLSSFWNRGPGEPGNGLLDIFNFLSKDQLTRKKDRILIKDLISNKWKYKTKKQGWFYTREYIIF